MDQRYFLYLIAMAATTAFLLTHKKTGRVACFES